MQQKIPNSDSSNNSKNNKSSRNMVFKGKNGSKTEFHGNGLLATLGSNFQEGQS